MKSFEVGKSPTDELSLNNCLIIHPEDAKEIDSAFDETHIRRTYVDICHGGKSYVFAIFASKLMAKGSLGFNGMQRKWVGVNLHNPVGARLYKMEKTKSLLTTLILEADFLQKKRVTTQPYDTDQMAEAIRSSFLLLPQTLNQEYFFQVGDKPYLILRVKEMEVMNESALSGKKPCNTVVNLGIICASTQVRFDRKEDSVISLTGKSVGKSAMPNIINPDWDFSKMGIGGLDDEFSAIFRRAFASRVFPPDLIEQLGMQHVKGILLFGPPGTGKTLMARQIGKMLNTREPRIVNGPEILNKYVGESEKNIRELFEKAEDDQKKYGINSALHMIIFDEIDAICKQRGTVTGSTGVADTVVNQLLSKIDGVEQLNNILIIGMTNRKDLIDEALLRPGRLEVQMEIGLPDEHGRAQILDIHTAKLKTHGKLEPDVSIPDLAAQTKNYSGAELEGLVRAATTTAMNRLVKVDGQVVIDPDAADNLRVRNLDFLHAIQNDIKPKFGTASDDSEHFLANGIIEYGKPMEEILELAHLLISQTRNSKMISPVSVLIGGKEGSGKTALAAHIAYNLSEFPCIKVCSPEKMIGFSETAKCQAIKQIFDDAAKSELSCIIVDDIERLLDYVPIGPRFSNIILQTLIVLLKRNLKRGRKLMIIGTSSCQDVLDQLQLLSCFNTTIRVPPISDLISLMNILQHLRQFTAEQLLEIENKASKISICISMKRLMSLVEMANEAEDNSIARKFLNLLQTFY